MHFLGNTAAASIALLISFGQLPFAAAQGTTAMLLLTPHCAETDRTKCLQFAVQDAEHLRTTEVAVGDILDLDIVLRAANPKSVQTVKAWLRYDPAVLEARSVELTAALPAPFPGEQTFDAKSGIVKIGGATSLASDRGGASNGTLSSPDTPVARVTFRILTSAADTTIAFHGFSTNGYGQTAVNAAGTPKGEQGSGVLPPPPCIDVLLGCQEGITPLLLVKPSALIVDLKGAAGQMPSATAASVEPSASGQSASGSVATQAEPPPPSSFPLLQVQSVVITTKDRDIFVGWQALRSSELRGYNVYYGTVSGRYIQRHSVPADGASFTIRDLEQGTTYFVAVRAFTAAGIESAFSQEVSVTVGKETSAVNPVLMDRARNTVTERMNTKVVGDTGTADTVGLILLLSAAIGTGFAFRRQLSLQRNNV